VVLELSTEGFYAEPGKDDTVRLEIPGWETFDGTGSLSIPVKRTWVHALAGRRVVLTSVREEQVETITGLSLSVADRAELVASPGGSVKAVLKRVPRRREARSLAMPPSMATSGSPLLPSEAARLVSVGFQEEIKKALVELAPLRWDGSSGRLLLARRLVVRLAFTGRESSEETRDGRRGRRRRKVPSSGERRVMGRLVTTERGLHAVRYEELLGLRGRARPVSSLRLSRQGKSVAFHLEPDAEVFGPGTTLYFLSEGATANPYGPEAVYELEEGVSGETMPLGLASPSGDLTSFYWERLEREENRFYQAGRLDAQDRWLWDLLFAPVRKQYPLDVTDPASTAASSHLTVWLQGASDFPEVPDHHVRAYVNGTLVSEVSWDGKRALKLEADLAPGLLFDGRNTLAIENVGDTGAAYSAIMLDRFELKHARRLVAKDGCLEGSWETSGTALVSGLGASAKFLDVTGEIPVWLRGAEMGAEGWAFRSEKGRTYLAVEAASVLRPEVRKPLANRLKSQRNRADYIVIAPPDFLQVAEPLLAWRRQQGLKVKPVSIEEVFSEFGFGETAPESIQNFLSYAYHSWERPSPRYVLLLGDATYDYKDYLSLGVESQVPAREVKTSFLWTASDPSYAMVNGDDLLPDLAIGRLPASTVEEVRVLVNKIISWETSSAKLHAPVVLVTDNPDAAGNFVADAEDLAETVLKDRLVRRIYLNELGVSAARDAIIEAFDQGTSITNYIGHGGIHLWADEQLFHTRHLPNLSAQAQQPILLTMNCLNGYFHFPYFDSLSEELVNMQGRGVIAAFSPSGLSLNAPAHRYHLAVLAELVHGEHLRLGDAILAAQSVYTDSGAFPELLSIYHLLGDPAMEIR
jgi:hypothetical protein